MSGKDDGGFRQRINIDNENRRQIKEAYNRAEQEKQESRNNQRQKNDNSLDGFCRNAGVGGNECRQNWRDAK